MAASKARAKQAKSRGGQAGNTNAVKHGLYSGRFQPSEREMLAVMSATIDNEIEAMRVAAARVFQYADKVEGREPGEALKAWGVFSGQVKTINNLLRTKTLAQTNAEDEVARAAIEAILIVAQRDGWVNE